MFDKTTAAKIYRTKAKNNRQNLWREEVEKLIFIIRNIAAGAGEENQEEINGEQKQEEVQLLSIFNMVAY